MNKSIIFLLMISAIAATIALAALAPQDWERLKNGEVIVSELTAVNPDGSQNVKFVAKIFMKGKREQVWQVLHDYNHFYEFFPNVKNTTVIKQEGEKYWVQYLTKVMWVEAKYVLTFEGVELNKRIEVKLDKSYPHSVRETYSTWLMEDSPDKSGTLVTYTTYIDTGIPAPAALAKKTAKMALPGIVKNVRMRVESGGKWKKPEGS